jgi:retron-type reverse transcriptase
MPRSFNNLYSRLCSFENLYQAYCSARRGKRRRTEVAQFELDLESNLCALQAELSEGRWQPGPYRNFYVQEHKRRLITAAPFRDRVVHHALVSVLEPVFEPAFIYDSYACRKGKGQHRAVERFTHFARFNRYVLRADITKFYPSVDHETLLGLVARRVKDHLVLEMVRRILASGQGILESECEVAWFPGDDLFSPLERNRGLPIGNLTSQFFGNVCLNALDHFVKEELRQRCYVRYMDDFAVFGNCKGALHEIRQAIADFLAKSRLILHRPRTRLHRSDEGVEFLGFRVFPGYRLVRKTTVVRFGRHLRRLVELTRSGTIPHRRLAAALIAWLGHSRYARSYRLSRLILGRAGLLAHEA